MPEPKQALVFDDVVFGAETEIPEHDFETPAPLRYGGKLPTAADEAEALPKQPGADEPPEELPAE
jgi:hypothetical protein